MLRPDQLVLWALPAVIVLAFIWSALRTVARIKARREAWATMAEADRQADRNSQVHHARMTLLWAALILAALLVYGLVAVQPV